MHDKEKLIHLGIAMDYAVEWDFDRILRDLVQNFYDSIGWRDFEKDFHIYVEERKGNDNILIMETEGRPFSYEWLTNIGGSTKTESPGKYIGMYGEGFKICALCLFRQRKKIRMESSDWEISVCRYTKKIDGNRMAMLGYRLKKRIDDGITRLWISGLSQEEIQRVDEAKLNFYYPENPLLGKVIVNKQDYAIYERSTVPVPCRDGTAIRGILFCNRLARGRLPLELVIVVNCDMRKADKRKRSNFEEYESILFLNRRVRMFDAKTSYQLLLKMIKYWNDIPQRIADPDTWYYVVCELVRKVASEQKYKRRFMKKYLNLVYLERVRSDVVKNSMIKECEEWIRFNPLYQGKRFVNPVFRLLGAKSVLEDYACMKSIERKEMGIREKELCKILVDSFEMIYPYKIYDQFPEIVLTNGKYLDGLQYCERDYRKKRNGRKYKIHRLVLNTELFVENGFEKALMDMAEKMLLVYGRFRSSRNNVAMTDLGAGIVDHIDGLTKYKQLWKQYCRCEVLDQCLK